MTTKISMNQRGPKINFMRGSLVIWDTKAKPA